MTKFLPLAVLTSLVLSACGGQGNSAAPAASAPAANDANSLAARIAAKGTVTVGTEGTYAPFSFRDASGQLTGYDVDVMNEVGKRLGVKVEYKETQWDAMFAGLNSGRFDLVANQVGINDERKGKYDFSAPYTYSRAVVVTRADDASVTSFDSIKGKKTAQSLTSNYGKMAEKYGAEITGVEGLAQAIELIKQKRVDITLNDELAVLDFLKQQGDSGLKIALRADDVETMAFVFNKGNEAAIAEIDKALESMHQDGTFKQISEKYFGKDVSVK
ncbi:amino acid ABC transporter substrate-binding protein [Vitreoscilla stercoraria]|uniref:Amino acid ABC transporter substrate-binding protein n=1 Tax=Vitreoscilla stercoraria TaxID=61 RepID=A0ABY4ED73_VITST|nr:amino acid ABC transporter substrate-binding protein [Vitreoscilla stercoraria]UOO93700.1 amino acid ABC transporter substrate-binding protein [Vitreoscilla stercoraria]